MKNKQEKQTKSRTLITDISASGSELSDGQLRLVAGGARPKLTYTGRTYINCCWYRRDYQRD